MSKLDQLLRDMESEAEGFDNYAGDDYDDMDDMQLLDAEDFARTRGEMRLARQIRTIINKRIRRSGSGLNMVKQRGTPMGAAQFDITVTRNTANITGTDLEIAIFGNIDFQNGYNQILALPTGGTRTVLGGTNAGVGFIDKVQFAYTVGVDTDTVDVKCNMIDYPSFLSATGSDLFRLSQIRYSISNPASLDQFSKRFQVVSTSMFGKDSRNKISVGSYKAPEQFQNAVIDVPSIIEITKQKSIVLAIRAEAAFEITLSMFVERFKKLD